MLKKLILSTLLVSASSGLMAQTQVTIHDILANRMRELAYLNAGITITLTDRRLDENEKVGIEGERKETFYSEGGLRDFVRYIDSSRTPLTGDVIYLNTEKQEL